ncbi:hypothetical protein T484DRAFT_1960182 [Baffinella frigidus]|nr:hypothetical protein T484DRAFT_1960182 [Cryptophyta sp. CCMP2293]
MIDTREQKDALESHLPRVIYHRVCNVYEDKEAKTQRLRRQYKSMSLKTDPPPYPPSGLRRDF